MIVYSTIFSLLMSLSKVYFISLFLFLAFPFDSLVEVQCVLVCLGCHNKISQTECLKQQKYIFLQIWRLGFRDQGAVGIGVCWGLYSSLADNCFITVPSHSIASVCVCVERTKERQRKKVGAGVCCLLIRTLALWD